MIFRTSVAIAYSSYFYIKKNRYGLWLFVGSHTEKLIDE